MIRKRWKWAAAAGVLVYAVIVACGVYVWPNREPFVAETPIGDGTQRLRLLSIGPGSMSYSWSDPCRRWIRLITPRLIRKSSPPVKVELHGETRFREPSSYIADESPAGHLLMRTVDTRGEYTNRALFKLPRVELVDSTGFAFLPSPLEMSGRAPGVLSAERTSLPRRDRQMTVRIAGREPTDAPIEFSIENPFFKENVEAWEGRGLPQSIVIDDTKFTLTTVDVNALGLTGRIERDGFDWRLEPFSVWFEDATGNRGLWLSPNEPAWKVHLTVIPVRFEALPAESIVQLPPIKVPAEGESTPVNQTLTIAGTTVEVRELRTTLKQAAGHEPKPAWDGQFVLEVQLPGKRKVTPIFGRAINEDGTKTREVGRVGGGDGNEWTHQLLFRRPKGDGPLKVELGIGTPRDVSFLVAPPLELKEKMLEFVKVTRTGKWKPAKEEPAEDGDAPKAAPTIPGMQMPPRPKRPSEKA